ncbi:MAG: HEAT repeat domain-containing protein [Planctomycetota bacterium]
MIRAFASRVAVAGVLVQAAGCGFSPTGEPWSTKSESSVSNPDPLTVRTVHVSPQAPSHQSQLRASALELLERAAESDNAQMRANALEAMQVVPDHLGPHAARGLVDENRGVRFVAAMTIGDLKLDHLAHLLEPLLRDESESVQAAAIFGLHRCGRPVDLTPLAGMIVSDDPEVRGNAALVLGKLGNPTAVPVIHLAVGRGMALVSEPRVKMVDLQMAEALVKLGEEREIEVIRAALFAPPEQGELKALACLMVGRLRDHRTGPNLVRLALQEGPSRQPAEVRMAATWALAHIDPDQAPMEVPLEYVADPLFQLRAQAAHTLGEIGDPAALPRLATLLDDENPLVQVAAAGGILRIETRSPTGRNRP